MSAPTPSVLYLVNDLDFFFSHRVNLAIAATRAGYHCVVASPGGPLVAALSDLGIGHVETLAVRESHGVLRQIGVFFDYWRILANTKPDIAHLITSKPLIFGGLAARLRGIPVVAAVSGLGFVYMANGLRARILRALVGAGYRLALKRKDGFVIFQNASDRSIFENAGLVAPGRSVLIKGSGVDLDTITPNPEPEGPIVALLPARILRDKGVLEFVEAARICGRLGKGLIFRLQGKIDPLNPTGLSATEVERWADEGVVDVLPHNADPNAMYAAAHIVVLPSYREGLSKTLVDAAAAGRAVVTTDTPGCRDAILPGESGLLVPVQDAEALADAITRLAEDHDLRRSFGKRGRSLAQEEFDIEKITEQHLALYGKLIPREARP